MNAVVRPWRFWGGAALWGSIWLALLAGAIVLSVLAGLHSRLPGDVDITEWVQGSLFPGMGVSRLVRAVGSTEVVLGTGAVVAVALWLMGWRRQALLLALGLVVLPFLQHGLKQLVDRPRPTPDLVELRAGCSSPSFPSGHVMSAALLYGTLLYLSLRIALPSVLRLALLGWCAFMLVVSGPANVYVGVHWPSDVVGGYAWAAVLLLPLVYADQVMGRRRW
ncbi:MAG: phosphatase PAP2 family protein [Dehalococcoidia bacterium]|nr:phosphatase PAP2 family protein [Dehalococcoidia bacterium]